MFCFKKYDRQTNKPNIYAVNISSGSSKKAQQTTSQGLDASFADFLAYLKRLIFPVIL
jgi:hypothetical protein